MKKHTFLQEGSDRDEKQYYCHQIHLQKHTREYVSAVLKIKAICENSKGVVVTTELPKVQAKISENNSHEVNNKILFYS